MIAELEEQIRSADFVGKGAALRLVYDGKLWHQADPPAITFGGFCKRFGFTDSYGRYLMRAAGVVDNLKAAQPALDWFPASEKQARALSTFRPDEQVKVWRAVTENIDPASLTESIITQLARTILLGDLLPSDVGDPVFPSDNSLDIPLLQLHLQADAVHVPFFLWGAQARRGRLIGGTAHFYTDDARFVALYGDPTPVVNADVVAACEPNFSIYEGTPRALAAYRIFMKRWIARWWQGQGIKIFVDLNVNPAYYTMNLLGVPAGWRAYSTRGYTDRLDDTHKEYGLACERAGDNGIVFLVYGGGKQVEIEANKAGWLWFPEKMNAFKESDNEQG